MRKQTGYKKKHETQMVPEYGQKKLIRYADSFKELADLIGCEPSDNVAIQDVDAGNRSTFLLRLEKSRTRQILSQQLEEMAQIIENVASESYNKLPLSQRRFKILYKGLKQAGVDMRDLIRYENEDGHTQIGLIARARGREIVTAQDVAGLMSVALNNRLVANREGPTFLGKEYDLYHFYEEPSFHVLTGCARAVKEAEKVSGDSFCFFEMAVGHFMVLLSDGTGSGVSAGDDSDRVITLLQKLLEAGFSKEKAVQILNNSWNAQGEDQKMPTLDFCDLNLYSGMLELLKIGAACTYIKREYMIDRISAGGLPLGARDYLETSVIRRELQDGDYVIMLSDGVMDGIAQGIGEDMFPEFLGNLTCKNPSEMANQILNYCIRECKGQIKDDMTVLVTGLWENTM